MSLYMVQFQAFDAPLATIGETDDLAFARQVMLAAYAKLCTPGQSHAFLPEDGDSLVYREVAEPIIALYDHADPENPQFIDSIGWTEV